MKYAVVLVLSFCSASAFGQSLNDIIAARNICVQHTVHPSLATERSGSTQAWEAGWESCADIAAAYATNQEQITAQLKAKEAADRVAADKAKVEAVKGQIGK